MAALATASGQAVETLALLNLAEHGGHVVASTSLQGGTHNPFTHILPKLGIELSFVADPDDPEAWHNLIRPTTRAFLGESLGNPQRDVFDFEGVAAVAHGAHIVIHSATKFIGGQGHTIGGVIVDGGRFDYEASGPFPRFTTPDPGHHRLVFSQLPEALHPARSILQARVTLPRDLGGGTGSVQCLPCPAGSGDTLAATREAQCQWPGRGPVAGGGQALRGGHRTVQPPRQRRRRSQPDHPSGQHQPQPARRAATCPERGFRAFH